MIERKTVEIEVEKDPDNIRYRHYYVNEKISSAEHRIFMLPMEPAGNEKLESDIGPIGAALIAMLNKIDALDFVYLTNYSVGLSKKRGRDWKAIENLVLPDIQAALGATAYRTKYR